MDGICREMLGVDDVVAQVTDELDAQGRLDNTLLIFTADNGISWGDHQRGPLKNSPLLDAGSVLHVVASAWGSVPRVIDQ